MSRARRPLRVRVAAALAGAAILLAPSTVSVTEAQWQDTEKGTATLTASVVPPVVIVSCTASGLLGVNPSLTVVWRFQGTGYTLADNIEYFGGPGGLLPSVLNPLLGFGGTTGPVSGQYTSTFGSGILTGLLGGQYSLAFGVKESNGWTSVRVGKVATFYTLGLLQPTCTDP